MGIPATETTRTPGILVHWLEDGEVVEAGVLWKSSVTASTSIRPESFTLASFLETWANLVNQHLQPRHRQVIRRLCKGGFQSDLSTGWRLS